MERDDSTATYFSTILFSPRCPSEMVDRTVSLGFLYLRLLFWEHLGGSGSELPWRLVRARVA